MHVCVAHINPPDAWSETFIRAHVERLPFQVSELYGGELPGLRGDGRPLLAEEADLKERVRRSLRSRVLGEGWDELRQDALRRYLRDEGVDVVLAEYGPVGLGMLDACRTTGTPMVVWFRGYDISNGQVLERLGGRYPELFSEARALVASSADLGRRLEARGAPPEKIQVIPSGTDMERFVPGDPAAAPPAFLFVGRFVETKGPLLLLESFRRVHAGQEDARLVLVGDGPQRAGCRQLIAAWGLSDAVELRPPCPHDEVAAMMRTVRAYVQHSVAAENGEVEGTPNAIVEASAAGLPVIATRHGGIVDAVREGETGLLVDEGDVAGMAAAIRRLAAEPLLAGRLGAAGREHVARSFSQADSLRRIAGVLRAAAKDGPR